MQYEITKPQNLLNADGSLVAPGWARQPLIAYNKLQGEVAKTQARMEGFADEFSSILSRQIDQHAASQSDRAA